MTVARSRRAFLAIALAALASGCDFSPTAPTSTASTVLRPPTTDPAFPAASGNANYRRSGDQRELHVEVEDVPEGTELDFLYNGTSFASATVNAEGRARIDLDTDDGDTVPAVVIGVTISVESGGVVVVSGRF